MTIRDIAVAFGFEVDESSVKQAEGTIKSIKGTATKLLGAIGIAFSITGIASLAEAAGDAEALKSQFTQTFEDMESEAASRLEQISDDTGILVNRMKGSFTQITAFAKTTGMETAEALELSDRAMVAIADSAAYYDRSLEDVTNSLQSFLKGNFENDAALGLSCTETTRNIAANELYGKSFKDLAESEKQLTLLKMVEDANKASGALGQAARESDTWTNQLGNLKQSIQDLKAAAGAGFLKPAVSVLKLLSSLAQSATKGLQKITGETGIMTRGFDSLFALVKKLKPSIDRMMQTFSAGAKITFNGLANIVDKLGGIENILKIVAIAGAAFLAVMAYAKAIVAIKNLVAAFKALDKAMLLGKLKVLAIVAVIVILALIVEDFINFLMGNDSIIGTFFDKIGIGADNARQVVFKAWERIKGFLLATWDVIKTAAGMFVDTIKGFFVRHGEQIRKNFERVWGIISAFLNGVWTFITQLAATIFGDTEDEINGSQESMKSKILAVWQAILNILSASWNAIFEIANVVFNAIATVIETVFSWIQAFWNSWGSKILSWFKILWDTLGGILNVFLSVIGKAIVAIFGIIAAIKVAVVVVGVIIGIIRGVVAVIGVIKGILGILAAAIAFLTSPIGLVIAAIAAVIAIGILLYKHWDEVKAFAISIWTAICDFFINVWEIIKGAVSSAIGFINALIQAALATIQAIWQSIWSAVSSFFISIWNGIVSFLQGILSGIASTVSSIKTTIITGIQSAVDWIKGLPSQAVQWGADIINGIANGIRGAIGRVTEAVSGVAEKIKGFLHFSVPDEGPLTDFESWMPDFMSGLAEGIGESEDTLLNKVKGVAGGISAIMKGATANAITAINGTASNTSNNTNITQNNTFNNSYSGGEIQTQKNISKGMNKSAHDATDYLAKGLAYTR